MKRSVSILLSLLCVLPIMFAVLFLCTDTAPGKTPAAIMVDGVVYYSTGQEMPVEFDESAIQEVNSYTEGIPTKDGQINFNPALGNLYAKCEEDVGVLINHEWVRFKAK